jgi:hypothetical protein
MRCAFVSVSQLAAVADAPGGRALVVWTQYRSTPSSGAWATVARHVFADGSVGPRLELGSGSAEAPAVALLGSAHPSPKHLLLLLTGLRICACLFAGLIVPLSN